MFMTMWSQRAEQALSATTSQSYRGGKRQLLSLRDFFPRPIRGTPFGIEGGVVTPSKNPTAFKVEEPTPATSRQVKRRTYRASFNFEGGAQRAGEEIAE